MSWNQIGFGYPVSGFLVGLLVGLTGVGGGSLMTPLLILVFGMRAMNAVGVDLLFAAVTKACGTLAHGKARTVEWRVAGRMLLGSIPTTLVMLAGLRLLGPPGPGVNRVAGTALGLALLLTAASVALRPWLVRRAQRHGAAPATPVTALPPMLPTVLLGVLLGVVVPLTSVGAAALGMPVLLLLYPRVASVRLVGADIAHAVPLTLVAGIGHLLVVPVDPVLLEALLLGSVPGVVLGSLLAGRVPDALLRWAMSAALLLAGWRILA